MLYSFYMLRTKQKREDPHLQIINEFSNIMTRYITYYYIQPDDYRGDYTSPENREQMRKNAIFLHRM